MENHVEEKSCWNCKWISVECYCQCTHCEDYRLPVWPFEICPAWEYKGDVTDGQ